MSNSTDESAPIPDYAAAVQLPGSLGKIIVYPISYKLGRKFKAETKKVLAAAIGGANAAEQLGLDDKILDLMDACCVPNPSEIDDLPLADAAHIFAKWIDLNVRPERWSFSLDLADEVLNRLSGPNNNEKISVRKLLSDFVSPLATNVAKSLTADGQDGHIAESASQS